MCWNTQRSISHNTVRIELHRVRILTHANFTLPRDFSSYMRIKFSECKKPFVPCLRTWQFADSPLCLAYGTNTHKTSWQSCVFLCRPEIYPVSCIDKYQNRKEEIHITWTNKMHYFLLIYFNSKPLHDSNRLAAHHLLCWLAASSSQST